MLYSILCSNLRKKDIESLLILHDVFGYFGFYATETLEGPLPNVLSLHVPVQKETELSYNDDVTKLRDLQQLFH